jgi:23S rRNA (adenine2503-C2)-methyltransferase
VKSAGATAEHFAAPSSPFGSAYGWLPEELAERCKQSSGGALFARLQRPWLWRADGPALGRRPREGLDSASTALPELIEAVGSADGSTKLLVQLADGARVETVHMPREVRSGRVTLCLSSQVGCGMGCTFCRTAKMGFRRQLSAAEIVIQVLLAMHRFGPRQPGAVTLVFMGMGEPLHNFQNVARAVQILTHPAGLGLSPRRITISTSGLVPEIEALGKLAVRPLLAVSLNATTERERGALMPIGRHHGLAALRSALERYPLRPRERITIEYVLLAGVNDTNQDAVRLSEFCSGFPHQVNLIPFNAHAESPFRAPSEADVDRFARAVLSAQPTVLTVRRSRGPDVFAACGQLATASPGRRALTQPLRS